MHTHPQNYNPNALSISPVLISIIQLERESRNIRVSHCNALGWLYDLVVDDQAVAAHAHVFVVLLPVLDVLFSLQRYCGAEE